jgi:hypothetical protein
VVTSTTGLRSAQVAALPAFDCAAFFAALDDQRQSRGLDWNQVAAELSEQSCALNEQLMDHGICPGALVRVRARGTISCQYALFALRWMGRAPEDFLSGPVVDVGDARLPDAGPDSRLRWNLNELYLELDHERTSRGVTWTSLAPTFHCTPSRLTNLRTARLADMDLAMRVTQWLGRPAAAFIHPAAW